MISVFCVRGSPLPLGHPRATALPDAMAAAIAADGYSRATGEPAIVVTRGLKQALRGVSAMPLPWGDRIPLVVVNVVPDEHVAMAREAYRAVVRDSYPVLEDDPTKSYASWLGEMLPWAAPAQLVVTERVDLATLLDDLTRLEPAPRARPPDERDLRRVAKQLRKARKPALLLGRQAVLTMEPRLAVELAEEIRCPILLTVNASAMPPHHLARWRTIDGSATLIPSTNFAWFMVFLKADVILSLGTSLSEGDLFGLTDLRLTGARIIHAGRDVPNQTRSAGDPKGQPHPTDLADDRSEADPEAFADALLECVSCSSLSPWRRFWRNVWVERARHSGQKLRRLTEREARRRRFDQNIDPAFASHQIASLAAPETIFLTEGNGSGMWLWSYLWLRPVVYPGLMATIGNVFPWAVGVSRSAPGTPLWGVVGDGAFRFQAHVLSTLRDLGIPAVFFVFNNRAWDAIRLEQTFFFSGHYEGTSLPETDFAEIARLRGCDGVRVFEPEQLVETVRAAARRGPDAPPLVVDVVLQPDSIPFAGLRFVLAELDTIWRPMLPRFVPSFLKGFLQGKFPLRIVRMATKMFFWRIWF